MQMKKWLKKLSVLGTSLVLGALAFAQNAGADIDPAPIAQKVTANLTAIAAAGVGVLALSVGLVTAFKYVRRFMKG